MSTLLEQLRQASLVDCDTLDISVARSLGPFQDCTSNQAIAYLELIKPGHEDVIRQSAKLAKELHRSYPELAIPELAVEIAMVQLGLEILPHIRGCMHIQTNPFYAYDSDATITAAQRIVALFQQLGSNVGKDRICIKIPSTWEGLQACGVLSEKGFNTLATTLFTIEQAVVAAKMGCTYIAPYVNELAVHFEPGFVDQFPGGDLCVQAQRLFRKHGYTTKVLPASLVSIESCMSLSGVDHITIAPGILQQLNKTVESKCASAFEGEVPEIDTPGIMDEKQFRILLTRRDSGRGEIKQVKAINVFADFQTKLEDLVQGYL